MTHERGHARRPPVIVTLLAGMAVAITACAPTATPSRATPAASASPPALRPPAPEGELPEALREHLQTTLEETMAEYDVPGATAGVWVQGEGAWTAAAGLADIESDEPATVEMMWPLRSITKSYTVTVLLQLVDEGLLSLDDSVGDYVEGVTFGDEITLRQLAGMSSGNADYTNDDFLAAFIAEPGRIFTLDELNGFMLGKPAQFAPGTRKVYTNANTNLLGAVIEKVTGQDFAAVLNDRVLDPLGQDHTRYIVDAATWTEPHATGYAPGDDSLEPQPQNLSIFGPAGSMISSLDDARAWGEILATGALLEPATQTERQEGAPLDAGPPYDVYALGIGETDGWWGHNGEGLGYTAALFHDPDTGSTVAVFMNKSNVPSGAHPADQMFRRVAHILQTGTDR